jgi:beta-mannosidase
MRPAAGSAPGLRRAGLLAAAAALLAGCAGGVASLQPGAGGPPRSVSLDGDWQFMPASLRPEDKYLAEAAGDWARIPVPSNWYLAGRDVSGAAWYRREFDAAPDLAGKLVRLVFDGVDYAADVWLNGTHVGFHEGSFQPFDLDVSKVIKPGARNVLVVRVDSPYEPVGSVWSLHKRLIKGVFNHHDTRPGGAWSPRGQDANTGGIWGPVHLEVADGAAIEALRITPVLEPGNGAAHADVTVEVLSAGERERNVALSLDWAPAGSPAGPARSVSRQVTLRPGPSRLQLRLDEPSPRLWWPAEQGEPNLYRASLRVTDGGRVLDRADREFAFRSVRYDAKTGVWRINGRRMFLRGTNYISSQWLSEMTPERYARDVALMQAAHVNAVRVHAHVEADAFYRECDRKGLLVWQDFPLQWGYSDAPEFVAEAERQVRDMVHMLYNHPSVIAWSLHNEPPWDADWMKYKYPDYDPNQNRGLDRVLLAAAQAEDQSRYIHPYSGTPEHPWLGWYSGDWRDYGKPTKQPLITEYGAQALPSLPSLRRIVGPDQLWPDTDAEWQNWEYHNFQRHETFDLAKVPMGSNIEQFIHNTQAYQARLTKYAAEAYRRQRYRPVGAIFQFMFVEDWPSVNWGVVDYWRETKPGYEALRTAYQPVLPSIEWDKEAYRAGEPVSVRLWVVNDLHREFPGASLEYALSRDGRPVVTERHDLDITPDSGARIAAPTWNKLAAGAYALDVTLRDAGGAEIGSDSFAFTVGRGP